MVFLYGAGALAFSWHDSALLVSSCAHVVAMQTAANGMTALAAFRDLLPPDEVEKMAVTMATSMGQRVSYEVRNSFDARVLSRRCRFAVDVAGVLFSDRECTGESVLSLNMQFAHVPYVIDHAPHNRHARHYALPC
jgi:hypothetical protein